MPLHMEEFSKAALQGYIETMPPQREYKLKALMPEEDTYDIDFAYNVINGTYAQAASITGWNASAPLRDSKELAKAFGEVAKVQHGQRLDEKMLIKFNRPRAEAEKQQAIKYVYDLTDDLSVGVDDIEEYMRAQAIYRGGMSYHDNKNDVHIDFEFDLPAGNRRTVTTAWDAAGATPISDIQAAVRHYQSQNQRKKPVGMHLSSATEQFLLDSDQVRLQLFGPNQEGRMITAGDVQALLTRLGLPNYEINDDVVVTQDGEEALLPDRTVVLFGNDLGNTMVGITEENGYNPGKFVNTIVETNPPRQAIIIGKAIFPALKKPQSVVILSV